MASFDINVFNASGEKFLPAKKLKRCVDNVLTGEGLPRATINIVITDDMEIRKLNKSYLNHDFVTDVITFPLNDEGDLDGEIYISVDTARRQATEYKVSLTNELMRLSAHGALHLSGYGDSTDGERAKMHELENKYISYIALD